MYLNDQLFNKLCMVILSLFLTACGGGGEGGAEFGSGSGGVQSTTAAELEVVSEDAFLLYSDSFDIIRINLKTDEILRFSRLSDAGSSANFARSVDIANNSLISVSSDNALNVLNLETGQFITQLPLGQFLISSPLNNPTAPVCTGTMCYAMGAGGDLFALDVENRQVVWRQDLFPTVDSFLNLFPLLVTQEKIFAGGNITSTDSGTVANLYAISRETGDIEKELEVGRATLAGDLLLVSSGDLHAYDLDTLELVWSLDFDLISRPVVAGDVIVLHSLRDNDSLVPSSDIIGIDRRDGSILWTRDGGTAYSRLAVRFFNPATDGSLIYTAIAENCFSATCISGYPIALNPVNGSIVWENRSPNIVTSRAPIVVEGQLWYDRTWTVDGAGVTSLDISDGSIEDIYGGAVTQTLSLTIINDGKVIRSSDTPSFVSDR